MGTRSFEINFSDLSESAQARYLAFAKAESASDLNADCCPLAIVEIEDEPEGTEGQDRKNYTDAQDRENYTSEDK
jgi:hypothetical protein